MRDFEQAVINAIMKILYNEIFNPNFAKILFYV
jgi:hypothetical protein